MIRPTLGKDYALHFLEQRLQKGLVPHWRGRRKSKQMLRPAKKRWGGKQVVRREEEAKSHTGFCDWGWG